MPVAIFERMTSWFGRDSLSDAEYAAEKERILQAAPVPVFWLFGKTGSGKTSVIKVLTGAQRAEIGSGFAPQTRRSHRYDFPSAEHPLMSFLDTRGLGEVQYDPAEDIETFADSTQLMIVTVRALDHALDPVIEPLRKIRYAQQSRPVLLVLTCLHEAYPRQQHPADDPYAEPAPETIPADLRRSIHKQQQRFAGLVDRIVPVDFTRPEEGFDEPNFGEERLKTALIKLLPSAYRQTIIGFDAAMQSLADLNERRAMPIIMSHSTMAATAAAVPTPWVDIPVVLTIQSKLLYRLANLYQQDLNSAILVNTAGSLGTRLVGRMFVREFLKAIPWVGMAANAALAFMYTFAAGRAWCWYFGQLRRGNAPTEQEMRDVWSQQLSRATELWQTAHGEDAAP